MTLLSKITINTRADLDSLLGTTAHAEFMAKLKGTMTRKQDIAVRPNNYGSPEYDGQPIDPVWQDVEDLTTIEKFGFSKSDFE